MSDITGSVAAAIVDRERISWPEAERLADSDRERAIVRQLRDIYALSRRAESTERRPAAALPFGMRLVVWAAWIQIAAGCLAFVAGERIGADPYLAFQLLLLATFGIAAFVLAAGGRTDPRARWLMAFYTLAAASFAHVLLGSSTAAIPRALATLALDAYMPYALWRFARMFPHTERFTSIDRAAAWLTRAALAIGLFLFLINFSADAHRFARDDISRTYWTLLYPFLLAAFATAGLRSWRADPAERRRVGLFAAALAAGTAPLLLKQLAESFGPPAVTAWTHTGLQMKVLDNIVLTSLLLIPPATTYAVLVRRALSVRLVIHQAARYALARASVLVLALVPAATLARYAYVHRDLPLAAIVTHGNGLALAVWLAAAIVVLAARTRLLAFVDARFGRSTVDRHVALAAAMASIRDANGAGPVAAALATQVARIFGARASVLVEGDGGRGTRDGMVPLHGEAPALRPDSALIAIARASGDPLVLSGTRLLPLLPDSDREWIAASGTDVLLPLHGSDGGTIAMLAVSAPAGPGWTTEDLAALTTLGQAAALAVRGPGTRDRGPGTRDRGPGSEGTERTERGEWSVECARCGSVAASADALACGCGAGVVASLLPPVLHGKYAVEQRIGAGGMGVVYRGRDLDLGRPLALKTLPSLGPGAIDRMRDEARAMATLIHPNLALIFGVEMWQRTPVLMMELLEGGTLAQRLARGPLPIDEALALARTIGGALSALHAQGLVHGDVKPSNIGFTRGSVAKLLDFGLARGGRGTGDEGRDAEEAQRTEVGGTPLYLPPEAFEGAPQSPAFDIWALAVVTFEMLAGAHPRARGDDVRAWRADVPADLAEALARALSVDPRERPATVEGFLRADH